MDFLTKYLLLIFFCVNDNMIFVFQVLFLIHDFFLVNIIYNHKINRNPIKRIELELPDGAKVTNVVNVEQFDEFIDLDGYSMSSQLTTEGNKIIYSKKNAFKKQRYSIDEKDKMTKIFQFYNDIANMNVIIGED